MNKGRAISKNGHPSVLFVAAMQCGGSGNFLLPRWPYLVRSPAWGARDRRRCPNCSPGMESEQWCVKDAVLLAVRRAGAAARWLFSVSLLLPCLLTDKVATAAAGPRNRSKARYKYPRPWYCLPYFCAVSLGQDTTSINGGRRHSSVDPPRHVPCSQKF